MSFFLISVCIHVFIMSCTSCVFNKYNINILCPRGILSRSILSTWHSVRDIMSKGHYVCFPTLSTS